MPNNRISPNSPTSPARAGLATRTYQDLGDELVPPPQQAPSGLPKWLHRFNSLVGYLLRRTSSDLYRPRIYHPVAGFLVSFVIHTAALIGMAICLFGTSNNARSVALQVSTSNHADSTDIDVMVPPAFEIGPVETATVIDATSNLLTRPDAPNIISPVQGDSQLELVELPVRDWKVNAGILAERISAPPGGGLEGRKEEARAVLIRQGGGTPGSENAVSLALRWLADHQRNDGGWRFDHREGDCGGRCPDPGSIGSSTGATAIALLPFLGRNETPFQGDYQEVVRRGLYYLQQRMKETRHGGDFQEGTMYAQGLSAICLSEAFALTRDEELRDYAQKSIDFICSAQHPQGGWRYYPGQPGDTTSLGWQMMALKSARLAGLNVPSPVVEKAKLFLDSVQTRNGYFYGYQDREKMPGPTSVAILCRMYTGWEHGDERLRRGVEYLAQEGPSKSDMYFNYYATQALRHYDGPLWERWNGRMREFLIETQSRTGHTAGSWFFPDKHGSVGGRLYTTAACAMILEVYYRHLPIYSAKSIEDEF